jgi:hypothetical protein
MQKVSYMHIASKQVGNYICSIFQSIIMLYEDRDIIKEFISWMCTYM